MVTGNDLLTVTVTMCKTDCRDPASGERLGKSGVIACLLLWVSSVTHSEKGVRAGENWLVCKH